MSGLGSVLSTASLIFATFASVIPFRSNNYLSVLFLTPLTVQTPASYNVLTVALSIPDSYNFSTGIITVLIITSGSSISTAVLLSAAVAFVLALDLAFVFVAGTC